MKTWFRDAANFSGFLHALDLKSGKLLWEHDLLAAIWGSPYVVDGKVMIGDEDGDLTVMKTGPVNDRRCMECSVRGFRHAGIPP